MSRSPNNVDNVRSEAEARKNGASTVKIWLSKIEKAKADAKYQKWMESAKKAIAAFESSEIDGQTVQGANLFHANVETITPSIYNSVPVPDLRVRYDERNKAAKQACELLERQALFDIDQCDFSDMVSDAVRKCSIVGEGIVRVRYKAQFAQQPVMNAEGQPIPNGQGGYVMQDVVESDETYPEIVPWDRFIRGPARSWDKLAWVAFEHDMTEEEVGQLNPAIVKDLPFASSKSAKVRENRENTAGPEDKGILDTIKVYEIWDKIGKQVVWLTPDAESDQPIKMQADPYKLKGFWPMPAPLRPSKRVDSMLPIVHYATHEPLFQEYENVCKRINELVRQLQVKGLFDAKMAPDFAKIQAAVDGEFFPAQSGEDFEKSGRVTGLADAVLFWPIEQIVNTIRELVAHRVEIKNQIWEATGVAEVMRGNSNKSKTLGANQMEQEAGTMRLKPFQESAANFSRDIMRIMIEMRAKLTPWEYMKQVASMPFTPTEEEIGALVQQMTPQPPQGEAGPSPMQPQQGAPNPQMIRMQAEQQAQQQAAQFEQEVEGIVRSPFMALSIDIETNSTLRNDVTKDREEFNQLITATGVFAGAVAQLAAIKPDTVGPMFRVFASQVRKFSLGREGEAALDEIDEVADAPPVDQNAPNEQEMQMQQQQLAAQQQADERKAQMEGQKLQADMALKQKDMELKELDLQIKRETAQLDMQMKQAELQFKQQESQINLQTKQQDAQLKQQTAEMTMGQKQEELQFKRESSQMDMEMRQSEAVASEQDRAAEREHETQMRGLDVKSAEDDRAHQRSMGEIKQQQAAKPKPNGARP